MDQFQGARPTLKEQAHTKELFHCGTDHRDDQRTRSRDADRGDLPRACGITFSRIFAYLAMNDARNSAGFRALADLMPEYCGNVSYGSEGGVFAQIGAITSVIVGSGSIEQAHKPNEFVESSQIDDCLEFPEEITVRLSKA
ncbi:hypothetical protein PXK05_19780 [Phaeobacter gallaeciensis]|nr:hypothetical protein [Phaeobacter gallaeciensis]MDE4142627.1 hypothetical protein [Phaeobacter gallaeciensis]MDE4151072.1 hypothetical protein [Phaeobacter gallaeciensis]MDE4155301.1 hypothetical protein [Phaeobacter gallaeciensis]MDE4230691.1 hypothetical protein [Phaeobacter gallaeciensis]MDE4259768.1 hypothetical protein [Phaeobacter gallaeciensis]